MPEIGGNRLESPTALARIEIPPALEPARLPALPESPLVSVLMANYNYASFIGNAIESVLSQTYENVELIVSDDGSTDSSCAVVESYASRDSRVRLVRGEVNAGQTTAINRAYAASRGQIICFLDSDDTLFADKIQRVVARFQERPNAGIVLHRLLTVDGDGNPIQEIPYLTAFADGWIAERMLGNGGDWPVTPVCGMNVRRELADLFFPMPVEAGRPGNVGGLFRSVAPLLTEVTGINEPLYRYRIHGQNIYGAMSLSLERLNRDCSDLERDNQLAQQLMERLGLPERAIDLHRSLQYVRWTFERSLLLGAPRSQLVRRLGSLARRIFADEGARASRKVVRVTTYTIALVLPAEWRAQWLNWALGRNAAKRWLAKALTSVGTISSGGGPRLRRRRAS